MSSVKPISTIEAKIARLNIIGESTKLYNDVKADVKNVIESNITLLSNEKLVFCYYLNTNYWWVITNLRLCISNEMLVDSYMFPDIKGIEAKDIFELGVTNQECKRLQIVLKSGDEKNLELENNTWFSVLNLLKFMYTNT